MPRDGSIILALSGSLRRVHEPILNSLASKQIVGIFPCSLIILIRIPLAIVQKRLAIQCAPEPVYRLGSSVGQSCTGGGFRVGSLKEERNSQRLIPELFEYSSELLMFRSR